MLKRASALTSLACFQQDSSKGEMLTKDGLEKVCKGGFFSESAIRFLDLQISKKKYSKKLS